MTAADALHTVYYDIAASMAEHALAIWHPFQAAPPSDSIDSTDDLREAYAATFQRLMQMDCFSPDTKAHMQAVWDLVTQTDPAGFTPHTRYPIMSEKGLVYFAVEPNIICCSTPEWHEKDDPLKYGINLPLSVLKGDPFYRDYCLLHELIHLGQILELHRRFAPAHYHELVTFLNEPSNVSPMEWLNAAIEEQILSRVNRTCIDELLFSPNERTLYHYFEYQKVGKEGYLRLHHRASTQRYPIRRDCLSGVSVIAPDIDGSWQENRYPVHGLDGITAAALFNRIYTPQNLDMTHPGGWQFPQSITATAISPYSKICTLAEERSWVKSIAQHNDYPEQYTVEIQEQSRQR